MITAESLIERTRLNGSGAYTVRDRLDRIVIVTTSYSLALRYLRAITVLKTLERVEIWESQLGPAARSRDSKDSKIKR